MLRNEGCKLFPVGGIERSLRGMSTVGMEGNAYILREGNEFRPGRGQALCLQQQISHVLVPAPAQ